ncbi:MAG: hypothetical protein ACYSWU_19285 [Planctomycetota bacterium]|jgi:hypothetical protein
MGPQKDSSSGEAEFQGPYDDSGVDLSLIRSMLALSPLERLKLMERNARQTRVLNEYGRQHRQARADSSR